MDHASLSCSGIYAGVPGMAIDSDENFVGPTDK